MINKRELATALALVMAASAALGQEEPPKQDPPAKESEETENVSKRGPIHHWPTLKLGYTSIQLSGSRRMFQRYGTPPSGLHLMELRYDPTFSELRHTASIDVKEPGQDDSFALAAATLNYGTTRGEISWQTTDFYDPSPFAIRKSGRDVNEGYIWQTVGKDLSIAARGRMDQVDKYFEPPADALRERTKTWVGSAGGSFAGGFLDLSFAHWQYWDRTDESPDTKMNRWGVTYARDLTRNVSVEGSLAKSVIEQPGRANSDISAWSVGGDWLLGDKTKIDFAIRDEKLDFPVTQNAYVRARHFGGVQLNQRIGKWSTQFGYKRLEVERVRSDQTWVDNPKWHTFEARLNGRISKDIRLTVKGARQTLDGKFGITNGGDLRALYWRNKTTAQVKLDTYKNRILGYAVYSFENYENDARGSRFTRNNLTLGASTEASDRLELYAEYSGDDSNGRISDPGDIGAYFPRGNVLTLGANWNLGENSYANLSFTRFATGSDNPLGLQNENVNGTMITGSYYRRITNRYELGLTIAPWSYSDDLVPQVGFQSTLITLSARARF